MTVLFDLSKPENRRTRKRRTEWDKIPKEQWPVCIFCGSSIPFVHGYSIPTWLSRTVCSIKTDTKEVKCIDLFFQSNNRNRRVENPRPRSVASWKKLAEVKERPKMSQEEADRLDEEQLKINIAIHKRIMERCGYVSSPGRSLTREEIEAIKHTITPVRTERLIVEHYRPWLTRGHAQP